MNTKLRNEAKKDFEKDFFKLLNNIRNYRDIKIVTTKKNKKNRLVFKPNYHTKKYI